MDSVLILEDHEDARDWLLDTVNMAYPQAMIKVACTMRQAYEKIKEREFDLALVDLNLPDGSGLDLIKHLADCSPNTFVVVTTVYNDSDHVIPALRLGADGYLLKDDSKEGLANYLLGIAKGAPPLSPAIAKLMMNHFSSEADSLASLTKREKEVLAVVGKSYTVKEISRILFISENTTSGHIKNIYSKLNISSRSEATIIAERAGLLD